APDWPLVTKVPADLEGDRITPILSGWLKEERKQGNEEVGRVVELQNTPVPLQVDLRKWPGVAVEQVADLQALPDESVSLLWTPFAVQRAKDRLSLVAQARRVLRPGGTWAFMDVLPAVMPGHWLYRFFPQVWSNEEAGTWDTSQLYNQLVQAGFQVKLARHNYHQPITSGTACEVAQQRETIPQLATLFDEAYESGLAALQEQVERQGKDSVVGSEFCLIEVLAVRG
ncbi:MAG: methyltransferase domain-containing protein, partial [Chloroflexota bacterium]